jgi:uncharacterized membrane protein
MWSFIWPLVLIVISNVVYHVVAKQTPSGANTFLSLTVTYLVGAAVALIGYFVTSPTKSIAQNFSQLNWTSYVLGLAIVGLETGFIYLYRAGWKVSIGPLVANTIVAAAMIVIGLLFYKEGLSLKQIIGIALCIGGLVLVNT